MTTKATHTPHPWTMVPPIRATGDERNDLAIAAMIDGKRSVIPECFWRVLDVLRDLAEMHDGRCDSCYCRPEPEHGYCGCEPMSLDHGDEVSYHRRCTARALLARIDGHPEETR